MNTPPPTSAPARLHPLLAVAAISVIALSAVGIATITGVLPAGKAASERSPESSAVSITVPPAVSQKTAAAPPAAKSVSAPKAVVKSTPAPARETATQVAQAPVALPPPPPVPAPCASCGAIENIRAVEQPGEASGLGAVAGGVIGGILGNQVGGGSGKKIATVAAAAGGAYAGHQIEKSRNKTVRYEIDVRMTDGSLRTLSQATEPVWRAGDPVRIENGALVAR
jgi:outer membrane lipoprotein SlyB